MRILIFSDLHNNYFALKRFYNYLIYNCNCSDKIFFLGDIIGYLKYDNRIIDLLIIMHDKFNLKMIIGNHDAAVFNYISKTKLDVNPSASLRKTIESNITYKNNLLRIFPFLILDKVSLKEGNKKYVLSHGGVSDFLNHYYYPDLNFIKKYREYYKSNVIYICGHTHRPFVYRNDSNIFINVGSIGLPRDNNPQSSFLEIINNKIIINRMFYQLDKAYEYNYSLPNEIKNRIYFGGKSPYLDISLINIQEDYPVINQQFRNSIVFKRAIYVKGANELWQIYKVKYNRQKKYLLRNSNYEKIYDSLLDLLRGIKIE